MSGGKSGEAPGAGGLLVPGGIAVLVFAVFYALGSRGGAGAGAAAGAAGAASGAAGGPILGALAVAALAFTAALGAFGPDLGMARSPLSALFGRRGSYGALWAERYGHDGGPTHSVLAAAAGTALVGAPAALVLGGQAVSGPTAAFAGGYLLHLFVDALSGRHPVRLLWPVSADRERGLGRNLGRAGGGAVAAAEKRLRGWLKPPERPAGTDRNPRKTKNAQGARKRTKAGGRGAAPGAKSRPAGQGDGRTKGRAKGQATGRETVRARSGNSGRSSGDAGSRGRDTESAGG